MDQNSRLLDRLSSLSYLVISPSIASSVNVANFVPEKLQWLYGIADTNYKTWKVQMLCLLKSQGLLKYTDLHFCPPLGEDTDPDVWDKNNALVKGWILGSVSDQIAATFDDLSDPNLHAAGIWDELEKKFDRDVQETFYPEEKKTVKESTPLHKAALEGDWEAANEIIAHDPKATTDWIDGYRNWRLLHIAVGTGNKAVAFVTNLVQQLSDDDLEYLTDASGSTALHTAAAVGNKQAAFILVSKNRNLCKKRNQQYFLPIHVAALYAQREVLEYLIQNTEGDADTSEPYAGLSGQQLLTFLIQAKFFDIALRLADSYPSLLRIHSRDIDSPLKLLITKMNALTPINYFNSWDHIFFSMIMPSETALISPSASHKLLSWIFLCLSWKCIGILAPKLYEKMSELQEAQEKVPKLLRRMCKEIQCQDFDQAADIFQEAIFEAAELDVPEVVEEVVATFPGAIYSFSKPSGQHIFHKAIENRSLGVFNLIYGMGDHRSFFTSFHEDGYGNNPLHSAGKLAPSHKLNETSGAALQMQREMQWFMKVEEIVHPYSKEQKNIDEKTPKMVFTEEHKELKDIGEKWMKETANSYALVAVLIATVMVTGAITVPGGNVEDTGIPMFSREPAFIAFAVSDAISLFASVTSLLLFLAILTARYAEDDFLFSLPTKLMFGLASLFLSIISMMVSFIVTLYLVFGLNKHWVIFPLLLCACAPLMSFTLCQYPLLRVLKSSTYGHGIFYQQSKNGFY